MKAAFSLGALATDAVALGALSLVFLLIPGLQMGLLTIPLFFGTSVLFRMMWTGGKAAWNPADYQLAEALSKKQ